MACEKEKKLEMKGKRQTANFDNIAMLNDSSANSEECTTSDELVVRNKETTVA